MYSSNYVVYYLSLLLNIYCIIYVCLLSISETIPLVTLMPIRIDSKSICEARTNQLPNVFPWSVRIQNWYPHIMTLTRNDFIKCLHSCRRGRHTGAVIDTRDRRPLSHLATLNSLIRCLCASLNCSFQSYSIYAFSISRV